MTARDPHFTEYVLTGSEAAFTGLVEAHIGMVHSTARRMLDGRGHAAADVAQMVFSKLALKARTLPPDLVVSVWLHKQAVRTALNLIRGETRRASRECAAAEHFMRTAPDPMRPDHASQSAEQHTALSSSIDRALSSLPELDQKALALRFFERQGMEEIGARLGLSAGTVQKRLSRALEKLRIRLERSGAVISSAALTLWLTDESGRAAPPSLAAATVSAALPAAAQGGAGGLLSFLTVMNGIKSLVAGAAIGLVSGGLWADLTGDASVPGAAVSDSTTLGPSPASVSAFGRTGAAAAQRFTVPAPAATAEGLLAQFLDIIDAPDTEMNRLRLQAWLERMPADQWKPLVALADAKFSDREKRKFSDLARQWAKVDPEAAMLSFLKTHGQPSHWVGSETRTVSFGGSLAIDVFRIWYADAPDKAGEWILKHQDDPQWTETLPGSIRIIGEKLAASSPAAALTWAARLQGDELRTAALEAVWGNLSRDAGKSDWPDACNILLNSEDQEFGRMAITKAMRAWITMDTNGEPGFAPAERWMTTLSSPGDRREVAELILSNAMQPRASFNADHRPDKALSELLASGPETASREIARLINEAGPLQSGAGDWLLPLLQGPERDPAILNAARRMADGDARMAVSNYFASKPNPAAALAWAVELSDPVIRDPLIRDLLQRQLTERSAYGQSIAGVTDWVEKVALKTDVRDVLRTSLKEFEARSKP